MITPEHARELTERGLHIESLLGNISIAIEHRAREGKYDVKHEFLNEVDHHDYMSVNGTLRGLGYETKGVFSDDNRPVGIYINWKEKVEFNG